MDKTAIVTGASKGIGRAVAVRLSEMGYSLALAARNEEQLEETASLCMGKAICVPTDITDEKQVVELLEKTVSEFGRVDVLINNAGMGVFKKLTETSLDEWRKVIDTNLTGSFLCAREAFKIMKEQKGGTVINIASVVGIKGYPNQGAYTASKHGMVGLTKVIAEEGREHGIRTHVICPGGVATEMVRDARPDINPDELLQPDDVADLVEYFLKLSPKAMVDIVHLRRFSSSSF
jgi:3-oxoacyl-[acyl-carrier protein] reductase